MIINLKTQRQNIYIKGEKIMRSCPKSYDTALLLLSKNNPIVPNANKELAKLIKSYGENIETIGLFLADHPGQKGIVNLQKKGLFYEPSPFDTAYIYTATSQLASLLELDIRELFYQNNIHGFIGRAVRFSEAADEIENIFQERPTTQEAVMVRWGYSRPCDVAGFKE